MTARDHVLVVGGAGYIGTALVNRLLLGGKTDVTVADSLIFGGKHALHGMFCFTGDDGAKFEFRRQDVCTMDLDRYDVDSIGTVVNLAAYSLPLCDLFPTEAISINRDAAVRLAKQCMDRGVHYIFPSTCSNYGVKVDDYAKEDDLLKPTSVYAKSKVEAEEAMMAIPHGGRRITILRLATAYGLGAMFRPDLLLHEFVRDAITHKKIRLYGAGYYRPLCHVDDIARAIARVIEMRRIGGVYNIGNTHQNFTKMELARIIQDETGCDIVEMATEAGTGDVRNYRVSFEKARKELGFYTVHEIKDEVRKMVSAYALGLYDFEARKFEQQKQQQQTDSTVQPDMG